MTNSASSILNQALELSALERADVAERLLFSLETPNSKIDAIWAKEVDERDEPYEKGEIKAVSAEEVFDKYQQRT
jgi:putative addiction module component (TIGR02574 family)